jgi:hypothetical protein
MNKSERKTLPNEVRDNINTECYSMLRTHYKFPHRMRECRQEMNRSAGPGR